MQYEQGLERVGDSRPPAPHLLTEGQQWATNKMQSTEKCIQNMKGTLSPHI